MKIKLMILSLLAIAGLQGSQTLSTFNDAIHWSMDGRLQNNVDTAIIYNTQSIDDIREAIDEESKLIIRRFASERLDISECKPLSATIISGGAGSFRVIFEKDLKSDHRVSFWADCSKEYESQGLDECLKQQRGLVVLELCANSGAAMTEQYTKDIDYLKSLPNVALILKVYPHYSGFDIEKFCENSNGRAIILNKPQPSVLSPTGLMVWCKKHWIVSGVSLIALLGVIHRYKHMFIKS